MVEVGGGGWRIRGVESSETHGAWVAAPSAISSDRKAGDFTRRGRVRRGGGRSGEEPSGCGWVVGAGERGSEQVREEDRGEVYERITGAFMAGDHMAVGRIPQPPALCNQVPHNPLEGKQIVKLVGCGAGFTDLT
jgi:hypothetical protein